MMTRAATRIAAVCYGMILGTAAHAADPLRLYGPGGPLPAMQEAAAVFGRAHHIVLDVTAGPQPQWAERAHADADLIFSGSEVMMSGFIATLPDIDPTTVRALYLRPATILVRPGNPSRITGIGDLLKPGSHRILVVDGAGQQGLWEDVAGRLGSVASVRAFRGNIARHAVSSAEAKKLWTEDRAIDAWLIWNIWQVANPTLADQVAVEPQYAIYRDTGIALTRRGEQRLEARQFVDFLASPYGAAIFAKWGWRK